MAHLRFPRTSLLVLLVATGAALHSAPAAATELAAGEPADAFDLATLVDGLAEPTDIAVLADGRSVVTQRGGDVAILLPGGGQIDDHIDVHTDAGEQGLLGVVADPNFATNGFLYFYASSGNDVENRHKVLRMTLSATNELAPSMTIVDQGLLGPANHDGGGLIIDDDYLYLSVGDTGHNATPPVNKLGTCLNSANGKILRVSLDGSIPAENPLVGLPTVTGCNGFDQPLEMLAPDERVFAWGFRNPFRFWVDPQTGLLWVGDVGEGAREEIAVGEGGEHFGWPFNEGTVPYDESWHPENSCMGVTPASECVPAAHDYPHEAGDNCVIGGLILAESWPAPWPSRYIFGDHGSGRIWTLDVNAGRTGAEPNSVKAFGYDGDDDNRRFGGVASFRIGADQALYIVEDKAGTVQRITPKAGTGGTGGTGGSGGAPSGGGGNAGTTGGVTTGGGGNGGTSPASGGGASDDGGCGCRVAGGAGAGAGAALVVALLGLLRQRRRRRA
jgi:MYXO-CTERM domain-containing protein